MTFISGYVLWKTTNSVIMFDIFRFIWSWFLFFSFFDHLKPQSHYSDNQSPTSPQPTTISNYQQPISNQNFSPQSVADCLPTDRRLFADRSPSGRQPIANYSPTDYRTYFTFWNLISNHLESNRRLVADCLAWRDLHNLLNHPAFKRNSYIFTTIRGQFHEYMLEFLLKWGWYNWLCKSAPTTSRRPVADQLRTTLPLFLHHLHFSGSNVYSFCMAALFGCRWLLMLHRKPLADQNCSAIINNHLPTIENHPEKGWLSEVGERLSM